MHLQSVVASQGGDLTKLKEALDEESQKTTTLSAELEGVRYELEAARKRSDELAQRAQEREEALGRALREANEELKAALGRVGEVEEALRVSCIEAEKRGEARFRASARFATEVMDQAAPLAEKAYEDCFNRARQLYPQLDFSSIALDDIYTDGDDSDEDDEDDEEASAGVVTGRVAQPSGQETEVQVEQTGPRTDPPVNPLTDRENLPATSTGWTDLTDLADGCIGGTDTTSAARMSQDSPLQR